MAVDQNRNDDVLRLNALVDGELSTAERATLASRLANDRDLARAHATLARLKASVVASAEASPAPVLAPPVKRRLLRGLAAVGAAAAAALVVAIAVWPAPEPEAPAEHAHTIVQLAAFPASPIVPDLTLAGLKLAGIATETHDGGPAVVATYQGPRGCRLVLRVQRSGAPFPAFAGTSRRTWTVGDLTYRLTAFGMPDGRFAAVAAAAEKATRIDGGPMDTRRLRQASVAAPPCVG